VISKNILRPSEAIIRTGNHREGDVHLRVSRHEIDQLLIDVDEQSSMIHWGMGEWQVAPGWMVIFRYPFDTLAYEWDGSEWIKH
jgi:hypothetical protein